MPAEWSRRAHGAARQVKKWLQVLRAMITFVGLLLKRKEGVRVRRKEVISSANVLGQERKGSGQPHSPR